MLTNHLTEAVGSGFLPGMTMTTSPHLRLGLLALALSACSAARSTQSDGSSAPMSDDAPPAIDVSAVTTRAATAICGALYRCCDADLADYFAAYRANDLLAAYKARLPPAAPLDETQCRQVVGEMLSIVPLGDWVKAAQRGEVTFDPAAFQTCVSALDHATCGAPARAALWDSTCLGFSAPTGGMEQRSAFHRVRAVGASCGPIRDGIGAAFYGTCDPTHAFCCYSAPGITGCQGGFDHAGTPRTGSCQAVSALGATCSTALPFQLCATGDDCDDTTAKCVAPSSTPLANGAACVDGSFHLLGECTAGWCNVLGDGTCKPQQANGASCNGNDQCQSGRCTTTCVPNELCTGTPTMGGGDAGVDAAPSPDAAPDALAMNDGERCASARDLTVSSTTSPVTGFTGRLAGPFGATDDYNPLTTSNLPPHCSVVYDARGKEVVYQFVLAPGDRFKAHVELADGKQAAIYLLNSCPAASWPDFDGTGACGSNEYAVGFCGPTGCGGANLNVLYPTVLNGTPTTAATFWLVIDQVAGADSTGFVVDWTIGH